MHLTIDSLGDLVNLVVELKKAGFLKDVGSKDILDNFGKKSFPIQIPVNLEGTINLFGNPAVKVFGKKIDSKVHDIWTKAIEAG